MIEEDLREIGRRAKLGHRCDGDALRLLAHIADLSDRAQTILHAFGLVRSALAGKPEFFSICKMLDRCKDDEGLAEWRLREEGARELLDASQRFVVAAALERTDAKTSIRYQKALDRLHDAAIDLQRGVEVSEVT